MFIKKHPKKWGKSEYVPYRFEGYVLYIGKGENVVSLDIEALQRDVAVDFDICQDYMGNICINEGVAPLMRLTIEPYRTEIYDTGEVNDKDEPVMAKRILPPDVENIECDLYPVQYPLEAEVQ